MKLKPYVQLFVLLVACTADLAAQETTLKGKVLPEGYWYSAPWLWGGVRVRVKDRDTGDYVPGEQELTQDQDWFHVARPGSLVDVLFDKGPCFVPDGLRKIRVNKENPAQPVVRLQKTRECRIMERRRRERERSKETSRASDKRADTAVASSTADDSQPFEAIQKEGGAATVSEQEGVSASITLLSTYSSKEGGKEGGQTPPVVYGRGQFGFGSEFEPMPTPQVLKQELEQEAELAREGGFFDTFQANFANKQEVYGGIEPLKEILLQFKNDDKHRDLFKQIGSVTPEMYIDVARAQFQAGGEFNPDNIRKVIKDEALSPGVRGSAIVAWLNVESKLVESARQEMESYFDRQDPSSEIFAAARVARVRLLLDDEVAKFFSELTNSKDQEYVTTSFEAVAVTGAIEGEGALPGAEEALARVATTDKDTEHRAAAVYATRSFALDRSPTALRTLFLGARDADARVRLQAVRAMGYGDLESDKRIRNVLAAAAQKDPDPSVRKAAAISLTGAK